MKRASWAALPVLLAITPASHAQSVAYNEVLRVAVREQPQVKRRELELGARREAAEVAAELPDPRLSAAVRNLPVTGPDALNPTMMSMAEVASSKAFPT